MSVYIRPRVTSARIFFTVALADRASDLLVREVGRLREAVRVTRAARPFGVDAWVVLPDHLHAVWTLPAGTRTIRRGGAPSRTRFTRSLFDEIETDGEAGGRPGFEPGIVPDIPEILPPRGAPGGAFGALCRAEARPYGCGSGSARSGSAASGSDMIRDAEDFERHVRYCWGNPVKHGLAARPVDWPYSSIHRDIWLGRVDPEWFGNGRGRRFRRFGWVKPTEAPGRRRTRWVGTHPTACLLPCSHQSGDGAYMEDTTPHARTWLRCVRFVVAHRAFVVSYFFLCVCRSSACTHQMVQAVRCK